MAKLMMLVISGREGCMLCTVKICPSRTKGWFTESAVGRAGRAVHTSWNAMTSLLSYRQHMWRKVFENVAIRGLLPQTRKGKRTKSVDPEQKFPTCP